MKVAINHTGVKDRQAFSDDELKNNYSFRVFPNPANEILTVQLDQSPQNKNYNIYLLNIGKQEQAQNII